MMMKTLALGVVAVALFATVAARGAFSQQGAGASSRAGDHTVTQSQLDGWKSSLSNWGRWGKDDQKGTINLITAAKRKQAAALVREGFAISLARDANTEKAIDNPQPYQDVMTNVSATGSGDRISVSFHGYAHTHFDGLAHHFLAGKLYNGYSHDYVTMEGMATKNAVINDKAGIFTRGILMDIPRLKGVPYLEPGTPIYVEDLEAWEKQAGVKVGPGDALFVRAGVWARRKALGPYARGRNGKDAGLDPSVIPWLKKRDIAILAADHPQYVSPSPLLGAVHDFALVHLGIHLIDNCDLEALSEAAAARKRWDFLLTMAPIPVVGGTGSPINPIATF